MATIYDNIDIKFTEGLQGIITNAGVKRVDFCVGYFNLRGWNLIVNQIDNLPGDYIYEDDEKEYRICRLLIGMHRPPEDLIRTLYSRTGLIPDAETVQKCKRKIAEEFRNQLMLGLPSAKDEWTLRRLSDQLKKEKVCVKLYLREPLHAKLYLAYRPDDHFNKIQAIMGSSNLTYSGLTKQGELNAEFSDSDNAQKLSKWFNDRWEDRFCINITKELIEAIDNSWAADKIIPPYYIYLKTVYHLSKEARNGINEYDLPIEFKHDLFDFQETAVKIAAKHLSNEKRGGAMIGDVVGLGKTITACAIAKLYEMHHACSTLIICPANLQDMWKKYIRNYDLKADVTSMSKRIDYKSVKYYRLVIIDESHNLRNSTGVRYRNIRELIEYQDCKVLLLTATPYNKDFSDLSNQLRLFIGDDFDLGIRPEAYIRSLGGDKVFLQQHSETYIRSIRAFEKSTFTEDWRELMKLFLVRRTRTFIKENYAKIDLSNSRKYLQFKDGTRSYFPERIPKAVKFRTEKTDQYYRLYSEEMIAKMDSLKLPRYGLSRYIDEKKELEATSSERQILENLSRAGARMMGFCKSTFFKRIDSSGVSFLLTLYRHILRNSVFIYAIDHKLPLPIGDENALPDDFQDDDDINSCIFNGDERREQAIIEDLLIKFPTDMSIYNQKAKEYYDGISSKGSGIAWIDSHYFKRSLKTQLKKDCDNIIEMIQLCGDWNPKTDQKLNELQRLIEETHRNEKIIVFSQYSDTAHYVYKQLKRRGISQLNYVTGNTDKPTAIVEQFSPISNKARNIDPEKEYRILIATDVLSEGQNLQDAHIIINYDLPWAIIRLIQRAGRVDRIGQSAEKIYCYSFFPAEGVENIIRLRQRLNDRINENAGIVGSDEIFFEGNEQNLRDMYNEKSGTLDEEDDGEVDLASQAFQIWKNATDADPKLKNIIPSLNNVIYSTKTNNGSNLNEGTITYAKTYNDNDMLTWINTKNEIVTQSQVTILNALECSADEPAAVALENHHELVASAIERLKKQDIKVSGILGNRFSTKYRIINLLETFCKNPTNTLFVTDELKSAIDEIYNYPLKENAKFILGQMLKKGALVDDIIDYILEIRKANQLCIINENKEDAKEPIIICSMGLRNKEA